LKQIIEFESYYCRIESNSQLVLYLSLLNYITSREFYRKLESLDKDNSEIISMQDKEEKDHQTMWKKMILQRMTGTYISISSEIDSIIHGQLPVRFGMRLPNDLRDNDYRENTDSA
jgi:hypothetical protein